MASAPIWKVFTPKGKYVAACKFIEDAAAVVASYGEGASIRYLHNKKDTVYTDGIDGCAGDSFDNVAEVATKKFGEIRVRQKAEYDAKIAR